MDFRDEAISESTCPLDLDRGPHRLPPHMVALTPSATGGSFGGPKTNRCIYRSKVAA